MEQVVHTVSSRSKGLLQVHSRDPVTLARGMAHQVLSDTQWECKDVPLEAWAACRTVHRWDRMGSRDQEAMALRARHHIMASQARLLTRVSNKLPIPSRHLGNPVARHLTRGNPTLRQRLLHTPREDHPISSPTCPHSPRGHCQAHPKGRHSLSHLILKPQPHSLASLPTPSSRDLLPVRPRSSQVPRLPPDHRANPTTPDPHRGLSSPPRSNSSHSLIHSSHRDTANTHRGSLQLTHRTLSSSSSSSKHNSHLISAFLLRNSRRYPKTHFSPTPLQPRSLNLAQRTVKAAPPAFRTCQGPLTTCPQVQRAP